MFDYDNINRCMDLFCDKCSSSDTFYGDQYSCLEQSKGEGWVTFEDNFDKELVLFCSEYCAKEYNLQKEFL